MSTGTPQNEIEFITKNRRIEHLFSGIYGTPMSKVEHINTILDKYNLSSSNTIFVGDSLIDKNAANKTGIDFIACIVGKNDILYQEPLRINDLKEINKIISSIS